MDAFIQNYLTEVKAVTEQIDAGSIERLVQQLAALQKRSGRLFIVGVGGSAAHASHAVNDFRKICGIEAYTPLDNVAELTARINDDSWAYCLFAWLNASRFRATDALLVFSVGGGSETVSQPLVKAVNYARLIE